MIISSLQSFQKKQFAIVSIAWCLIAVTLLLYYGVNDVGEAFKYLLDGKSIAQNKGLNYGEFSYFFVTYSLFLSFFIKYKISLWLVALIQISLSYCAAFSLYKLIWNRSANHFVSMVVFCCYLFCYSIQKWIFFIYSEGVHTSLVVIGFCIFVNLLYKYSFVNLVYFIGLSTAIITTRPVGILFLLSACLTFLFACYRKKQFKVFAISLIVGLLLCTAILNSPIRYFINPDSLRRMELICMVPQEGITSDYKQYNRTGLVGAFKVVKDDIGFSNFFKGGIKKLILFFGFVRPYYSLKNNIFLAVNWLFYPFALLGIFYNREKGFTVIKTFSILIVLITAVGIFVTCDDWSNRFIAPVFPFIIILAGLGIDYLKNKINPDFQKSEV